MEAKIIKRSTTRYLKHEFSEDERVDLAEEMARKVTEAEDLEDQKKAVVSEFSGKINTARAKANSKAKKITSGFEMRQFDCEEKLDYGKKEVAVVRLDNDEIVEKRTMSNLELQQLLDLKQEAE